MPQTKAQKQKIVAELKDKLNRQKAMVFVDVKGVKVKELAALKRKLKEVDAQLQVIKKTLFGLACKEQGIGINPKELSGQIGLVFGFGDEVAPAKEVYNFAQTTPALQIVGGYMEGRLLSKDEALELAKLPTRQELLAKIVGSISSPLSGLVNLLGGNIKGLLYVLAKAKTT